MDSPTGAAFVGRNGSRNYEGIAIPFCFPGASHPFEYMIRLDHPEFEIKSDGTRKPKERYLWPIGRKNRLWIPPDADPILLRDVSVQIWITEGPLKGLSLWRAAWIGLGDGAEKPRALPIAINGVWGFRGKVGKSPDADGMFVDEKGIIPDFDHIELHNRAVVIIFDSDQDGNASVKSALRDLTCFLQDRDATVAWFPWPKDRPAELKGIDDFLATRGPQETLKLIARAKVQRNRRMSSPPPEPIAGGPCHLTELGNAERLVRAYRTFRYCGPRGKFLVHDGVRWIDDDTGQMERYAKMTVRDIYREAADCEDSALRAATGEWAKRSEKASQITAMLRLAASEPGIPIMPSELDADPWSFNCKNGTLDLRTGTLRLHRRDDLITKLAPVEYDPQARCPRFLRFLDEVFDPHPDAIAFIQSFAGYSLTADTREECLAILYGTGRNGKGLLLKVLSTLLGDYAGTADFSTFVAKRDDRGPRDDIANMRGSRFISAQEGRDGSALAESIVKWLTGGDRVRARKLHQNSFEFDPTWKICLATNYKPVIKGTDPAIWSRIRLVPFDVSFDGREDKTLKIALMSELPGVLNWALEGCMRWQSEGLPVPESVVRATGEYRAESDQVARFLEDRCVIGEHVSAASRQLYIAYKAWAQETGERENEVLSETAFGLRLGIRFKGKKKPHGKIYEGVALRSETQWPS